MVNDQHKGESLLSAPQQTVARPTRGQGRRARELARTSSMILVLLLLLTSWRTAGHASHRASHPVVNTQEKRLAAQPTPTRETIPDWQSARLAAEIDILLTNEVSQGQFSGSVLVAHDGQVLLSKGYSMADWEQQIPNTPHTQFYLGSTTKQFTAMAILILQEQGKLRVHNRLCVYITPCPQAWQAVTLHELLTHTSGLAPLTDDDLSDDSPQAWIASYGQIPLVSTPGSQFNYCNTCYQLLGYVVEQVSGEAYNTFLQQTIFAPLQMRNTGFDPSYLATPQHAVGYMSWQSDATLAWSVTPEWSFLFASGLLSSTVEDLYRWDQALYRHTLVSQALLDAAFTPYTVSEYAGSGYGYGWFIGQTPLPGHRLIWHNGVIDGFRTFVGRYVDDRLTIIFLSNLATVDELALAHTLGQLAFAVYEQEHPQEQGR